jgi:hypothetical protein
MFAFEKRDVWQQGRFSKRGFYEQMRFPLDDHFGVTNQMRQRRSRKL